MKANAVRAEESIYFLCQLPRMRPYIVRLLRDLERIQKDRMAVLRELWPLRNSPKLKNSKARRLVERKLEVVDLEERQLQAECESLGLVVGIHGGCELLFPTSVDGRQAYFIWRPSDLLPILWRWTETKETQFIPERWYRQFPEEAAPKLARS